MSWEKAMQRILRPIDGIAPHVTSAYDAPRDRGSSPHGGVDFNYKVPGQKGLNLKYPPVYSPVEGVVAMARRSPDGKIVIRDAGGFTHEILHTENQYVVAGQRVLASQPIAAMGRRQADAHHVHYQIKDRDGRKVNPVDFWNEVPVPPVPLDLDPLISNYYRRKSEAVSADEQAGVADTLLTIVPKLFNGDHATPTGAEPTRQSTFSNRSTTLSYPQIFDEGMRKFYERIRQPEPAGLRGQAPRRLRQARCNSLMKRPTPRWSFRAAMSHGPFVNPVLVRQASTRRALSGMTSMERRPVGCRLTTQPRTLPRSPLRERLRSPSSLALGSPVIRQFRSIEARRLRILVLVQRRQEIKMLPAMMS